MKLFYLKRIADIADGTFGVLFADEIPFAITLERKWLNNKSGESCIPTGEYTVKRIISPKFGETFEVMAVMGRAHILFHKGNIDADSHGCILVAERFDYGINKVMVGDSKGGFIEFMGRLSGENEFKLIIKNIS